MNHSERVDSKARVRVSARSKRFVKYLHAPAAMSHAREGAQGAGAGAGGANERFGVR